MYARNDNGTIKFHSSIPLKWNNDFAFSLRGEAVHKAAGFFPVVQPVLSAGQRKGVIYFDEANEVFKYEIVEKSEQELRNEISGNAESAREHLIQERIKEKILSEAQALDDVEALENAAIYPMWQEAEALKVGQKVQAFDGVELKLYKVVQAHTTQSDWPPSSTPALFTRVGFEDEILDWVQPTGAQDAYNTGDKVKFEGSTYESIIDDNVWSPAGYPQGWKVL